MKKIKVTKKELAQLEKDIFLEMRACINRTYEAEQAVYIALGRFESFLENKLKEYDTNK